MIKIGKTDKEYFDEREEGVIYVSKTFTSFGESNIEKRFIQKVYNESENLKIEKVKVTGEYVLRSSTTNRKQIKLIVLQDSKNISSFTLQAFINNKPQPESFTFRQDEFHKMIDFLKSVKFLDLQDKSTFRINESAIERKKVLLNPDEQELLNVFNSIEGDRRLSLLESLRHKGLTKEDLDILSGRRSGLNEFAKNLNNKTGWLETQWQAFFSANAWIFGYGLDYKFLQILQKESHVSNSDLDGTNSVVSDYLLGSNKFTVLVELKRPDTPLFEMRKNRSESWKLSKELTYAVSQILSQKAEWEIKSKTQQFNELGEPINQQTIDPKTILIIGSSEQFEGTSKEQQIKARTFELFRRNSRNIEILTYSELFERASFIVNQKSTQE